MILRDAAAAWRWQQYHHHHHQVRQQQPVVARYAARPQSTGLASISSRARLSASSVTKKIMLANSTVELLQLHAAFRDQLDSIHYAALFNRLLQASARCNSQQHRTPVSLTDGTTPASSLLSMQQQLQLPKSIQQDQLLLQQLQHPKQHQQQLLQVLLADLPFVVHSMQPGPLTVIMRSLVKLGVQPEPQLLLALLHHAHQGLGFRAFSPRQLCTLAHALAELQPVALPWTAAATAGAAAASHDHFQQHQQQQQRGSASSAGSSGSNTGNTGRHGPSNSSSSRWDPVLLQDLFSALGLCLQRCNAQDAAQAVLAVSKLKYTPSEAWLRLWLTRTTQLLPKMSPQGLANAAYGLVRALQLTGALSISGSFDWTLGGPTSTGSSSSSSSRNLTAQHESGHSEHQSVQQQQQQQEDQLLAASKAWLQSCLKVSVLHLSGRMGPQELIGQLLWAAGKLSCMPPQPARHHLLMSAQAMLPRCDARHLCCALYAFAVLGISPDPAAVEVVWGKLSAQAADLSPRDLTQLLWSAGQLQLQPTQQVEWLLQQQALVLFGGKQYLRHLVGVLRGMVGLGWQLPARYVVRFQAAFLEQLEECCPQDYANALWALATAGVKVEGRWLDRVLMAASAILDDFTAQQLSNTLWALARLQHNPPKPWLQQLLLASLQQMQHFRPADYAQLLWGLCKLGFSPSPLWLSSFWAKSGQSLTKSKFTASELHALLLAVTRLEAQPPRKWVAAAAAAVEGALAGFGSQQLLEVLQALQQLWQARTAAAAAASAAAGSAHHISRVQGLSVDTNVSSAVQWGASSVVPIGSHGIGLLSSELEGPSRHTTSSNRCLPEYGSASSSSSSSKLLRVGCCAPGTIRLYRQLAPTSFRGTFVLTGKALNRPLWPPSRHGSNHSSRSSGPAAAAAHVAKTAATWQHEQQQQHVMAGHLQGGLQGLQLPGDWQQLGQGVSGAPPATVSADEAYSLACLVLLMPPQLRSKLEHWPQLLAADRLQQQQQQYLQLQQSG